MEQEKNALYEQAQAEEELKEENEEILKSKQKRLNSLFYH